MAQFLIDRWQQFSGSACQHWRVLRDNWTLLFHGDVLSLSTSPQELNRKIAPGVAHAELKSAAARMLVHLGEVAGVPQTLKALPQLAEEERISLAQSAGRVRNRDALPLIQRLLADPLKTHIHRLIRHSVRQTHFVLVAMYLHFNRQTEFVSGVMAQNIKVLQAGAAGPARKDRNDECVETLESVNTTGSPAIWSGQPIQPLPDAGARGGFA